MTTLEIVLLTLNGVQALLLFAVGAATWHQEKLIMAQFRWFQDQMGRTDPKGKQDAS